MTLNYCVMRIGYDLSDLEAFVSVMETGSFHRAAQRLNLSQSAVTRRMQKLEAALDSVLFERTTRAVRPTLAAKRLQARAEAILEDARETARAMRDESVAFAHQRGLVITLASIPTIVDALLSPAIAAFRADGHRARLRVLDLAANDVSDAVAAGEADFGICWTPSREANAGFEPLFDDRMGLVVPRGHALAARETLRWDALAGEALVLPARGTGNRMLIDDATARRRVALSWSVEAGRSSTALALVRGGAGVAVLPRSALAPSRAPALEGDLVWRGLEDPKIIRPIGLLTRLGQTDTAAVAGFKSALRRVAGAGAASSPTG
ncbi:MAG: LysR family transcriptional regulator [Pseudomonadota bacterium]